MSVRHSSSGFAALPAANKANLNWVGAPEDVCFEFGQRDVATAVTWLWRPKFPYKLCSDPVEAERWAKDQLAAKLAERR